MQERRLKRIKDFIICLDEQLGSGSFGKVFKGEREINNQLCAIKMIDKKKIKCNEYLERSLMQEIQILLTIKSENIVSIIEVLQSAHNYYIIQELCDNDLQKYILQHKFISEEIALTIISQIANGFITLVKQGIIHRDLKPANILMCGDQIKIADFGYARNNISQKMKIGSTIGTPLYMSPQVLKGQPYSSKCDVWGLGFIFYELLHKKTPWYGQSSIGLLTNIQNNKLTINPKLDNLTIDFLRKTLEVQQNDRLSWDQVFSHKIFQGMFDYLKNQNKQIENKLKMVMKALRQQIQRKNIDIKLLLDAIDLKDRLNLDEFTRFIKLICEDIRKEEILYMFDKIDTDDSGTVEIEEIQDQMKKHMIQFEKIPEIKRTNTLLDVAEPAIERPQQIMKIQIFKEMHNVLKENGKSLKQYFDAASKNTGSINFQKFARMMRRFGQFLQSDLHDIFSEIDLDKSNSIEYNQIVLVFCQVNRIPPEALERQ